MSQTIVNSESTLSKLIGDLREQWRQHRYLRVNVKTGKDRSLDQNAIAHVFYQQIADELREGTALDIKCECKLLYGVPILRAEDAEFRAFYDASIKRTLTHEQKIKAMAYLPVTSLMTVKQLSAYIEAMQDAYRNRGVYLEFPEDDRRAA